MRNYGVCDLHGHFLPGMDDGSRSVDESVKMLKMSMDQGIYRVFATPHYYPVEKVDTFLNRRQAAMERLRAGQAELPEICLGAEVAYWQGVGMAEDLEKLCLGSSRYLLLELPFSPWERNVFRDVGNMANVRGIIPVIAHIERYLPIQKQDTIREMLNQDVLLQINASALLNWRTRRTARNMLQSGTAQLLGSDCHNLKNRAPDLGPALEYLKKCRMEQVIRQVAGLSEEIFSQAAQKQ